MGVFCPKKREKKIIKKPISPPRNLFTLEEKESNNNQNMPEPNINIEENKNKKIDEIENEKSEEIVIVKTDKKNIEENKEISDEPKDLKIILFPENKPKENFRREPLNFLLEDKPLGFSFDINRQLGFVHKKIPVLNGFLNAYINHYPIRIKPDDIWLLIVQAFSHHVNANSEELRNYFVNFDGKKTIEISYVDKVLDISQIDKKTLEDFSKQINEQMIKYLGEEIVENLTPNFTTTNYDSTIICIMSIMGAFKKYFDYRMSIGITCGFPYIIIEGSAKDYYQIKSKAIKLSKYKFDWYINGILPIIEKMIEAKEGKVDIDFFKRMISYFPGICGAPGSVNGWILNFFAYINAEGNKVKRVESTGMHFKIDRYDSPLSRSLSLSSDDLENLAAQQLIIPFTIKDINLEKEYKMKYKVGFIGCDQNEENEVFPIQGWIVSPTTEEEINSIL